MPASSGDSDAREALDARIRGEVLAPGDPGYGEARAVWNARVDRRPALLARCTSADDVAAGVDFARERGLPLSVRGGGHHVSGHALADGGLTLDLGPMDAI
nr:FAD-binding protein [Candidatus Palauibacterales bacterium]